MLYEKIDRSYLNWISSKIKMLDYKKQLKYEILDSYGLKAYDISKIKVTTGGQKLSPQEQAVLRVEKINKQIVELEAELIPIKRNLELQIERVIETTGDFRHGEILKMLYIEGFSVKDVILELYSEDTKATRSSVEGLRKTAEKILSKVSETPFIKVKQLVLEDW